MVRSPVVTTLASLFLASLKGTAAGFLQATHRVWHAPGKASWIEAKALARPTIP